MTVFKGGGGERYSVFLGKGKKLICGNLAFIGGLDYHLDTMLYYLTLISVYEWLFILSP